MVNFEQVIAGWAGLEHVGNVVLEKMKTKFDSCLFMIIVVV